MSTEIIPSTDYEDSTGLDMSSVTTEVPVLQNGNDMVSSTEGSDLDGNYLNGTNLKQFMNNTNHEHFKYSDHAPLFEVFVVLEILMTTIELLISIMAMIKMRRWRRNYRNQMLLQLSVARFIKRVIFTIKFSEDEGYISTSNPLNVFLSSSQIYIDFVIVILVFFFIKHMYSCLIIVLVKISQNNFFKVLCCSWLIPVPVTAVFTVILMTEVMNQWSVYLTICCVFRWPLIFIGTGLYITILYRVMSDNIRHFARSLTVVTFFLCLLINIYLFSKDIIELFCMESYFTTILISYVSGLLMNCFILSLYVVLLILSFNNKTQSGNHLDKSFANYSLAEMNTKR